MSTDTSKYLSKLTVLTTSLDNLESELEPLLSQSLAESLVGLETIQQAKLQTLIPYLIYDLIFIYLKARGIDPKTHSVFPELERVRQYFGKITAAENSDAKPSLVLDKAAAGRFIRHAIAQATRKPQDGRKDVDTDVQMEPPSSVLVETRVTAKMLERASYEAELKQGHEAHRKSGKADDDPADSDSDGLEVYEDEVGGKMELKINDLQRTETPPELIVMPSTLASNDNNTVPSKNPNAQGKRKRPVVDPFSGYNATTSTSAPPVPPIPQSASPTPAPGSIPPTAPLSLRSSCATENENDEEQQGPDRKQPADEATKKEVTKKGKTVSKVKDKKETKIDQRNTRSGRKTKG